MIIFLIAMATLCALNALSVPQGAVAAAADIGSITVTYDGEEYVCSDGDFSSASLQSVINHAESIYSQINYTFVGLTVRETLTFKKSSLLQTQGTFNFVLNTSNSYAITVNEKSATLTLQGAYLNSNRGAINVNKGKLIINSANITVAGCTVSQSAINVYGEAVINGGEIIYSNDNSAFGYGVSVNGGNLTVTSETAVKIEGYSALCMTSGKAELNGGEYKANRPTDNTAGYSVDAQGGNLTINDGTFAYPIYDRAVISAKININGGSVSSVRVTPNQNKKLNIGALQVFAGNYCELNINDIDFTANTLELSGKKSLTGGFRIAGFTVGGTAANEPVLTVATDGEQTVAPIESKLYTVSFSCDGTVYETVSYAYGTTVNLSTLPAPEKTGYVLTGWEEKKNNFTLNDDITRTAITELADTDIEIADTVLTYDGTEQTVTPVLTHDLTVTYTAIWEKFESSDWVKVSDGTALKVTTVADSGTYRITVVATADNGTDSSSTQKEVTVNVNKGTYTGITHPEFNGVYDPVRNLGAYTLNADFSWVDVTTVPTVPNKLYPAIYNADPDNYNDLNVSIKIDLEKAAAVSAYHPDINGGAYQHKQLKDYKLNDGFRWQSPEQIPVVNTKSYPALYNPDPDNYEDYARNIGLRLTKGTYENIPHLADITMDYRPNYYMSDLSSKISDEHANYRLIYGTYNEKLNAGTRELTCAYNKDLDNYNDYTFTFVLTVNKTAIDASDVPEVPSFKDVYSGLPLSEYQLGGYLYWRNPEQIPTVDVRTYDAFYNPEPGNYTDFSLKVTITLEKGSYENITVPTLDEVTYGLTLADIRLPEGWAWKNPSAKPTVAVNGYEAEYCLDPTNYLPYSAVIGLTVNKANITPATLPDKTVTYDGKVHSLEFENLSEVLEVVEIENNGKVQAGKYEVKATLRQLDTANYNLH
ncbi:MAG: InlB B-repeat-containing protein, partial [Clostridia bacterium]|nr:InlB B-repeat-containing protein [Clostridia bacterium]